MLELEITRPLLIATGNTSFTSKTRNFRVFDFLYDWNHFVGKLQQQRRIYLFEFTMKISNYQK